MAAWWRDKWSAALALSIGAALRLWMLKAIPQIEGDTLLYGDLAKNMLLHGRYAISDPQGGLHETLLRLPGYPLILALCFKLFGMENYWAVLVIQIVLELAGCLLLAAFVRRIASRRAALWTLWLAALCPFTAAYSVAPLTETLTLFAMALALWATGEFAARPAWRYALAFTFAVTLAAMLRPDGALVAVSLGPALLIRPANTEAPCPILALFFWRKGGKPQRYLRAGSITIEGWKPAPSRARLLRMGAVCLLLAALPFAVWTARNWRVFHVIQPLAPRYATDPGETLDAGWQRWVKTWCLDFTSTFEIYWNIPDGPLDVSKLPARAFDSPAEYAETVRIARQYARDAQDLTPEVDAQFARLADQRVRANPLRYYVWLPLGRMADMWLRPRVENLDIDLDWWVWSHHHDETLFSWFYAGLNAAYIVLAGIGLWRRPRYWPWMLLYFALRSALLMTIEAPEARYTLECFPMLCVLAGIALAPSHAPKKLVR